MADKVYPFKKYNYRVQMDKVAVAAFSEISGFDASIDVIEYREGTEVINSPRKMSGLTKYGNVTLKWGMTDSMLFYNWVAGVSDGETGETMRTKITIYLRNDKGVDIASWELRGAWPCKYTAPDFNASASEIAFESVEIAFEEMVRATAATA